MLRSWPKIVDSRCFPACKVHSFHTFYPLHNLLPTLLPPGRFCRTDPSPWDWTGRESIRQNTSLFLYSPLRPQKSRGQFFVQISFYHDERQLLCIMKDLPLIFIGFSLNLLNSIGLTTTYVKYKQ